MNYLLSKKLKTSYWIYRFNSRVICGFYQFLIVIRPKIQPFSNKLQKLNYIFSKFQRVSVTKNTTARTLIRKRLTHTGSVINGREFINSVRLTRNAKSLRLFCVSICFVTSFSFFYITADRGRRNRNAQ